MSKSPVMATTTTTAPVEESNSKRLKLFLVLPFFTLVFCVVFIIFIFPFYVYRSVIHLFARCSDLKVSRMATGLSASLLRDYDVQDTKPLSTIVVRVKCRGTLSLNKIREQFRSNVLLKKDPNDPKSLQFPELLQYYKMRMGYVFMVWDRKFDLNNHITQYTPKRTPMTRDELNKFQEDLMVKPFPKERSPWELVFIDNGPPLEDFLEEESGEEDRDYFMFLRIHHGIADGFSVQNLLLSLDGDRRRFSSGAVHLTKLETFVLRCKTFYRGPYDLLKKLMYPEPYHTFHLPTGELSKEYFVVESDTFQANEAKRIAKHFKVGLTTILSSAVCGGIRRYLERTQKPFPVTHTIGIPFATKEGGNTSQRLENDFLILPFDIPLDLSNPQERIQKIHQLLRDSQNSTLPQMLRIVIDALSCLSVDMMRVFSRSSLFSTAYSTLPGPLKSINGTGWRLMDVNFTYGMGAAGLGLCFSSITYMGSFQFMIFVDRKLMEQRENAKEMIRCIQEEFKHLGGLVKNNLK